MASRTPPIPPEQRSRKAPARSAEQADTTAPRPEERNRAEQGRQRNIKQNTTNQGYQQDR